MHAPDRFGFWLMPLVFSWLLLAPSPVLAYAGPGAGLELVGYFMGLVVWAGLALGAVVMWPFYALLRRFRGPPEVKEEPKNEPTTANVAEMPGEGSAKNP